MSLILLRHGNTFEAGQTPVWVGARTDLPLTAEGEAQARAASEYLARICFFPSPHCPASLVSGPLKRTRRMAEIIGERAGLDFTVDERLREIDYGLWEGLSGEEISRRYGAEDLERWERGGIWPDAAGWSPAQSALINSVKSFLRECHGTTGRIAVTSNGILRIVHSLVTGQTAGGAAKVKTGHVCVLEPNGTGWNVVEWNKNPEEKSE